MENKTVAINWDNLLPGSTIYMKDFPKIKLIKLDSAKAAYVGYDNYPKIVEIKEYASEGHGNYMYFQTNPNDWHPLTTRLWKI